MSESMLRKAIVAFIFLLVAAFTVVLTQSQDKLETNLLDVSPTPHTETALSQYEEYTGVMNTAVFVPYWIIPDGKISLPDVPQLTLGTTLYFGITPTENAINTSEPGYTRLDSFRDSVSDTTSETLLTLRMNNEDINTKILNNQGPQQAIINQTVNIAQEYSFDGIALDLEHSVLPTQDVTDAISSFVAELCNSAHFNSLTCAIILYGDTYYRVRPYNVAIISESADMVYIMAYDFHKSFGEPGPNFPLSKGQTYPYSLESMLIDFMRDVPSEKLSIIFGMFGYDWAVDDQDRPLTPAEPLTLNQIVARTQPECPYSSCNLQRDIDAAETNIIYFDESGQRHSMWYEDERSVQEKISLIRKTGISSVGFWAYGYYN